MKTQKFIPLLVIAVGAWAYFNSVRNGFVFDDVWYIVENPHIRQLWPPWDVLTHNSRPVVLLSLAMNYALGGLAPKGYHVFNVGIHILAALTLYGVLRRTLASEALPSSFGRAAPWLAAATSLIWLVHPLQTESVTYTIQRSESLMGLFYLLTLYCVIHSNDASSRANLWKIGAVLSCALGMACKPVMVTAPLVTVLYDRAFLVKSWREAMQRRGWLYAGLAATWLLLPSLLANAPTEWKSSAGFDYKGIPPFQYARMQSVAVLRYLRLTFWPRPLCLDYGWRHDGPEARRAADALPELIVVGALLTATVWAWRRKPALGFLGAWFFIILAPTSSFIPIADPIVEHRMYLPLAGVVTMVMVGAFVVGKRLFSKSQGIVLGWVAGGLVVVLLANLTIQRNRDYVSSLTIWQDTVAKCPQNPRAHNNLGLALFQRGNLTGAVQHFEQAVRIMPDYADAHYNLGNALERAGKGKDAIGHYEQALRIDPDMADAHNNLGAALLQAGKLDSAIEHYSEAVRIKPDFAEAHSNLGLALFQLGRMAEAVKQFERALQIKPDDANAQNNLARLLATLGPADGGDPVRAVTLARRACELTGNRVAACLDTLAAAYAAAGRFSEAIATAQKAIELARSAGQRAFVREIENRLGLYRDGRAYRLPVGGTSPHNP